MTTECLGQNQSFWHCNNKSYN